MLIRDAYAQGAGMGGGDPMQMFVTVGLIFVVFYFLLIRPQQKKMKDHKQMLAAVKRGDNIITGGGLFGKVHKVQEDGVLLVDIAENVRVKVVRETVSTVLDKTQPAAAKAANENRSEQKRGGLLSGLFSGGAGNNANANAGGSDGGGDDNSAGKDKSKD